MQYKLGYLWKGKGASHYFVLVAAQVAQIAPVEYAATVTGGEGEYLSAEDLRELGDDSIEWRIF